MPPLLKFSNNAFKTRDDVLLAANALLEALEPYKSSCGARIKLSTATGTGFDETSAQLEGFARPLWVVADLLALKPDNGRNGIDLSSWVRGLYAGVDPESDTFWGYLGDADQRMVEMEPIAYALLAAPSVFFPSEPSAEGVSAEKHKKKKAMLVAWLRSINDRNVPPSNWRWFRILVNLALVKTCGVPYQEVKPVLDLDLELLDTFYLADGWSSDGLWSPDKKQADYYSGSFAIQYSQLAYIRFAHDIDPERVQRYRFQAVEFSTTFWRYFDTDGAAIPFGRSLTYRWTFAAFWAAVAVSDVHLHAPLNDLGVVKGLLLRHLRWWAQQPNIFNVDGTLNIGYTYPNMYMSEDYNSPQSIYWCLKSLSVLGLTADRPFWTCDELPHPFLTSKKLNPIEVISPVVQITCSTPEHHFLLSAGQFTRKPHKAREAKYGKFAYSSAFGFSVPTGTLLEQMAPDNTLSVSDDGGETWRARWEPIAARVQYLTLSIGDDGDITSPALFSGWHPWRASDLLIETTLIPPLEQWPGWHIRVHKLSWQASPPEIVQLVDSGFAINGQGVKYGKLPQIDSDLTSSEPSEPGGLAKEGFWEGDYACLVLSDAGASGVCDLSNWCTHISSTQKGNVQYKFNGSILRPDANTNLVSQRTLIPTLRHSFDFASSRETGDRQDSGEVWFITGIFALTNSVAWDSDRVREMWENKPKVNISGCIDVLSDRTK